jgi:hypothetical protein
MMLPKDHSAHIAMLMAQSVSGQSSPGGIGLKQANLPASYFTARSTLANSKQQKAWVDIPTGSGVDDVKLHTWIEYPSGTEKRRLRSSCSTRAGLMSGCWPSPINSPLRDSSP